MTKDESLKLALEGAANYIDVLGGDSRKYRQALAQPEKPKYRRGSRVICLETEEYCVIHISGTDRQWVKFPDSQIGVYTNEQVAELFELLPKEPEQEPVALYVYKPTLPRGHLGNVSDGDLPWVYDQDPSSGYTARMLVYTTPPQRKPQEFVCSTGLCHYRKPLSDEEIRILWDGHVVSVFGKNGINPIVFAREIEAAHGIKE